MRKIIGAINMTIDGDCNHTSGIPDEEIHDHYTNLLNNAGVILYGRITYQLMEDYWPNLVKNPSGKKSMDDFARSIHTIPKIVFSRTLKELNWENVRIAEKDLKEEVLELKDKPGKDIFAGSRSMIIELINLNLLDELQLCVHPVVMGQGIPLFENFKERMVWKLTKTKTFGSGAILLYYNCKR